MLCKLGFVIRVAYVRTQVQVTRLGVLACFWAPSVGKKSIANVLRHVLRSDLQALSVIDEILLGMRSHRPRKARWGQPYVRTKFTSTNVGMCTNSFAREKLRT